MNEFEKKLIFIFILLFLALLIISIPIALEYKVLCGSREFSTCPINNYTNSTSNNITDDNCTIVENPIKLNHIINTAYLPKKPHKIFNTTECQRLYRNKYREHNSKNNGFNFCKHPSVKKTCKFLTNKYLYQSCVDLNKSACKYNMLDGLIRETKKDKPKCENDLIKDRTK
ncbi:hypothetical protein CDIK_2822 [Cucumispora dikerogammari]|nr:hypothetical protein CDIK_2822 [Cucumispora dikerogammari]